MTAVLGRFNAHIFAIFRIFVGLLFMVHGTQKLLGYPPMEGGFKLPAIAIVAGYIELICGFLVAVGLIGGIAAFIASGEMAVGYFVGHAPHGFWPINNKGELAVLYCFAFLYISAHGSGIWSLDSVLFRRSTTAAAAT